MGNVGMVQRIDICKKARFTGNGKGKKEMRG